MDPDKIDGYISSINDSKKIMRKLTMSDLCDNSVYPIKYENNHTNGPKIKSFRQQKEYGEKKRIKP